MVEKDSTKIPMCPYCGSKKLERIDWGFADWECQTCRNNFKSPYYKKEEPIREYNPIDDKYSFSDFIGSFIEYFMKILLLLCVLGSIIFILVRLYQVFILPFL